MKLSKFNVTASLSLVCVLAMSGCGGDSKADTIPPKFTSLSQVDVNENRQLNHIVKATDASGNVSYSKDGGANEELFEVDATSGVLEFSAPDVDADKNYIVNIKATDSFDNNNTQIITVTVKNVVGQDAVSPQFTSPSELNVTENIVLNHMVVATDAGGSVSYSKDATSENGNLFEITTVGALTFQAPAVDADTNYEIIVKAEDLAGNSKTQEITILVKEAGEITNRAIMPMDTDGLFERDAENNTVLNTKTGFIWEDSTTNENNVTFAQAKAHCEQLKSNGFAGINDWKLPGRADLFKLVDYSTGTGNFVDDAFLNSASGAYWSLEEEGDNAWAVIYSGGTGDFRVPKTLAASLDHGIRTAYVRCVSGDYQPARFTPTSDDTRTDMDSGLIWQAYDSDGNFENNQTWSEASSACEGKSYRLPTVNELRSIVDYETGEVYGELTITTDANITHSARTEDNGFGGNVWTSVVNNGGKIKTLYITKPQDANDTVKDEIYDSSLDRNETSYYIKTLCVKEGI